MLMLARGDPLVTSAMPSLKDATAWFAIPGQAADVVGAESWIVFTPPFATSPNEHVSLPSVGERLQEPALAPLRDQVSPAGSVSVSRTLKTGPPVAVALMA
jgi:hypothetical protein